MNMPPRMIQAVTSAAICVLATLCGQAHQAFSADAGAPHFADADDAGLVAQGQQIYEQTCSSCHGRRLQGQALWQLKDQFAGRRAPAHDATGHTWQHPDEDLFQMTKFGRFAATPPDTVSYMPAFEGKLSDHEILAALAFIKSRWPIGLRATQAMTNPGFAGMPANADKVHWTLPPNCIESIQIWQQGSK